MKILALLLIAFALTGGELADSPLQQRVLALKNALMPGEPGYYAVQRELPGKKLFRGTLAPGEWDDAVMFDSHYHKNAARPPPQTPSKNGVLRGTTGISTPPGNFSTAAWS